MGRSLEVLHAPSVEALPPVVEGESGTENKTDDTRFVIASMKNRKVAPLWRRCIYMVATDVAYVTHSLDTRSKVGQLSFSPIIGHARVTAASILNTRKINRLPFPPFPLLQRISSETPPPKKKQARNFFPHVNEVTFLPSSTIHQNKKSHTAILTMSDEQGAFYFHEIPLTDHRQFIPHNFSASFPRNMHLHE